VVSENEARCVFKSPTLISFRSLIVELLFLI